MELLESSYLVISHRWVPSQAQTVRAPPGSSTVVHQNTVHNAPDLHLSVDRGLGWPT